MFKLSRLLLVSLAVSSLFICSCKKESKTITLPVAVAGNLSFVFPEIKNSFEEIHPEVTVQPSIGSSGKLTAQIKNGAPFKLFLAANMKYPLHLYKDGYAVYKPLVYAKGSLILFSKHIPLEDRDLKSILEDNNVKSIAIAKPELAPYGDAAMEVITAIGLKDTPFMSKMVYAQNVSHHPVYPGYS